MAEAITTAREAGCDGTLIVRDDSAYYSGAVVAACRRAGARFSFTVTMDPKISRTIAAIDEEAFTPIRYPRAIFDEASGQWISDAQVAEVGYTAFAAKAKHRVTARLIVRRVKDLAVDQDELSRGGGITPCSPTPSRTRHRRGRAPRPCHHRTGLRRPV